MSDVTVRFDLSAAEVEGAIRDKLIALGWTPPGQAPESFQQRFIDAVNDRNELHGRLAEAAPKAKLWDTLNAALMSRSGITLDNERDCYEAARQWAEASDDAHSYKMAAAKAREDRDAVAALKVELLTIPLSRHDPRPKLMTDDTIALTNREGLLLAFVLQRFANFAQSAMNAANVAARDLSGADANDVEALLRKLRAEPDDTISRKEPDQDG